MPGWEPLIVCDGVIKPCTFLSLVELIKNGIHDMVIISTLIVVAVFIFAGMKLLTSGGNSGALTQVKDMLWKVVLGYMWIIAAWVIVYTITSILLKPDGYFFLG